MPKKRAPGQKRKNSAAQVATNGVKAENGDVKLTNGDAKLVNGDAKLANGNAKLANGNGSPKPRVAGKIMGFTN